MHELSDSAKKKLNTTGLFPFLSFTENGEWVCALLGGFRFSVRGAATRSAGGKSSLRQRELTSHSLINVWL